MNSSLETSNNFQNMESLIAFDAFGLGRMENVVLLSRTESSLCQIYRFGTVGFMIETSEEDYCKLTGICFVSEDSDELFQLVEDEGRHLSQEEAQEYLNIF